MSARFVPTATGRLFVVTHRPPGPARGCVLLVPPFAEEMNKSRRMLTLVARDIAARGSLVVLPDLFGTGDSDGDFADASWQRWQDDLRDVRAVLRGEGHEITAVLAVRAGCALAAEAARAQSWHLRRTVFWQPVVDGERFLTQFLRLRVAAALLDSDRRESASELRSRLQAGETLEVAGYAVSPSLASQLAQSRLASSIGEELGAIHWMEVVRNAGDPLPQAAESFVDKARGAQLEIELSTVAGEPFWSSTEIVEIPALVESTVEILAAA